MIGWPTVYHGIVRKSLNVFISLIAVVLSLLNFPLYHFFRIFFNIKTTLEVNFTYILEFEFWGKSSSHPQNYISDGEKSSTKPDDEMIIQSGTLYLTNKESYNFPAHSAEFSNQTLFSKRVKVALAVLCSLIKHAKISQSQSLLELFK